jgi:hypothetical protein
MKRALAALVTLAFAASPALAEDNKAPAPAKAEPAKCVMKTVGKGLERKAVCVFEAPVTVTASNKPNVLIVPTDGRKVVGRPKSGNRLDGLSHTLH